MHFVNELGVGVLADEAVHDLHRLVGLTDFVVRPRHLVEHLVVAFVIRIGLEDLLVGLDGFPGPGRQGLGSFIKERIVDIGRLGEELVPACRPFFKLQVGLARFGRRRARLAIFNGGQRRRALRSGHLDNIAVSENTVSLLDLQVGKAAHGFRCALVFRGFREVTTITLLGALEAVLQSDFLEVCLVALQFGERPVLYWRRAAGKKADGRRNCDEDIAAAAHSSTLAWACDARS